MALVTDKAIFLHTPKCAGTWVRACFHHLQIPHQEIGHEHADIGELLKHKPLKFLEDRYVFTFTRHPLAWWKSRWCFRMTNGWSLIHPLDQHCASNNFNEFVYNGLKYQPHGWCTHEYHIYCHNVRRSVDYIGKTENAANDLATALHNCGHGNYQTIINKLKTIKPNNQSTNSLKPWLTLTAENHHKLLKVEEHIINRHYR